MTAIMHITSTKDGEALLRQRDALDPCGLRETPHIVFMGGWLCMGCGSDTRDPGDQGEPNWDPECACGSREMDWDWDPQADEMVCTLCGCWVGADEGVPAVLAYDTDPTWLDTGTPHVAH